MTATQVLDLAGRDPVRCRFGLNDDDLARLGEWVVASGVRWGFDAEHRLPTNSATSRPIPGRRDSTGPCSA